MDENIVDLANKLYEAHQNPIVKLNTGGTKIYLPKDDNSDLISNNLEVLKRTLEFPRVEKRCVRSQGIFLQNEKLIKISILRNLKNYGYRDKTGFYLHLEEGLYLLETNRLEILFNNIPMSIQQAYNLFLDNNLTLSRYRTYKKLLSESFKVNRRKIECSDNEPPNKRIKSGEEEIKINMNVEVERNTEIIKKLLEKLKKKAPKEMINKKLENEASFCCSKSKEVKYKVHLVEKEFDPKIGNYKEEDPNLFAIISNDDIPFYKISKVSLPNLFEINEN